MKHIVENIWEVFRAPIRYIKIFDESFIEWLLKFQPTILSLWIKEDVITSFETLDRIFKNLKVESFDLESIKTDKTTKVMEPIPFPYITVQNSYWLTLPAILNGSYTIICLYGSELTPKDINTILKEWQMGTKLQSLLSLEICTVTLLDAESCIREIYKDLNLTLSDRKDENPTIGNIHDENIYRRAQEKHRTLNLVRSDGTIGSITRSYTVDKYRKNAIYFRLFVW
ncbi:hypothetical protein B9Z55_012335 [Caenorhabditis nigoni]|nr:hypothetical protein B9Z55_012335 [Caenorhabditis nigoni]